MELKKSLEKILYSFLFVVLVPLFLIWWSLVVKVPFMPLHFPVFGLILAIIGLAILGLGMFTLSVKGKGLPMNAFPPKKLVTGGIYRIIPHPIYFGFVLTCLGLSLKLGSATGLWLTTPLALLACVSLVVGYERHFLLKRYGKLPQPLLNFSLISKPIVFIFKLDIMWKKILSFTEKIANSWHEKRIGPIRIISHGIYAGLAGGIGAFLVILLAGSEHLISVYVLLIAGIIGAAIIGQLLVGASNKLSRPFGYFGGLFGVFIAGILIFPFEKSLLLIFAAFACAGPFVQGIGRIRCLIQGCCHGNLAPKSSGIIIQNEHTRVCALTNLGKKPIYPTQLYSIIGNIFIGILLIWLWIISAPLTLIVGLYLALAGVVRFIEESYRGEPLTKIIFGLHIYQWFAIISFIAGMLVMLINSANAPVINYSSLTSALITGILYFFTCWFALGVDFPNSKVRFSRLSG